MSDALAKKKYYEKNKAKILEDTFRWQTEHLEKVREYKRNWKRRNPDTVKAQKIKRRAAESIDHFTGAEWSALLNLYGEKCLASGVTDGLSADHVIPLALGGSNGIENIQPLCVGCNSKKGIKAVDYREL